AITGTKRHSHFVPKAAVSNRSEVAPHSITSSARASSVGGTSRPNALAVLRLITSLLRRCLYRKVGRLFALEDAIDVAGGAPILVDKVGPVGNQAAAGDEVAEGVDRGQKVPSGQRDDQAAMDLRRRTSRYNQAAIRPA